MSNKISRYSDIIDLPHHQSERRPHMSVYNRAAQFAPFAALVGYDEMVQDTEDILLLDRRIILDEDRKSLLDREMQFLVKNIQKHPEISVTYFDGTSNELGLYSSYLGRVKKVLEHPTVIVFEDGKRIMSDDIVDLRITIHDFANL